MTSFIAPSHLEHNPWRERLLILKRMFTSPNESDLTMCCLNLLNWRNSCASEVVVRPLLLYYLHVQTLLSICLKRCCCQPRHNTRPSFWPSAPHLRYSPWETRDNSPAPILYCHFFRSLHSSCSAQIHSSHKKACVVLKLYCMLISH